MVDCRRGGHAHSVAGDCACCHLATDFEAFEVAGGPLRLESCRLLCGCVI